MEAFNEKIIERNREFSIATLPGRVALTIPGSRVTPRHRASAKAPGSVATPGISARQPRPCHSSNMLRKKGHSSHTWSKIHVY